MSSEEDEKTREPYVPPHRLGLDPEHHDKFTADFDQPYFVTDKDGRRFKVVTNERGEVERIPQ